MKHCGRFVPLLLAAALAVSIVPARAAEPLTRGEAAERLLAAAADYNPGVEQSDILKGYADGTLDLEGSVTRAQALVMLNRAFGGLPAPVGDNARMAIPGGSFTDVPAWAGEELADVLRAGIVAGAGEGRLAPDRPITDTELETLIRRVYALEGSDVKDDFYAAVNKNWLDASTMPAGLSINGPFYGMSYTVNQQVAALIAEIDAQPQTPGTAEAKVVFSFR